MITSSHSHQFRYRSTLISWQGEPNNRPFLFILNSQNNLCFFLILIIFLFFSSSDVFFQNNYNFVRVVLRLFIFKINSSLIFRIIVFLFRLFLNLRTNTNFFHLSREFMVKCQNNWIFFALFCNFKIILIFLRLFLFSQNNY